MKINLIVAVSENNVIGRKGELPWNVSEDLIRFKNLTINHPVVMGRKTYESLPEKNKPLPKRINYVLSKKLESNNDLVKVCENIKQVLILVNEKKPFKKGIDYEQLWVIGGCKVFESFLPIANVIELTRIKQNIIDGDVFMPKMDLKEWNLIKEQDFKTHCFQTFKRVLIK